MFVSQWLRQLQRSLFPGPSLQCREAWRCSPVHRRVRLCLEVLEDRLAPSADLVTVAGGSLATSFSVNQQDLTLTATVTDATQSSISVNEGTVSFTVKDQSGNAIGSPVTGLVQNGSASASFTLPAAEAAGKYTIDVSYSDTPDGFTDNGTDTAGTLTVNAAATTITASSTAVTFGTSSQNVTLTAAVTSSAGTVNEGKVTFTLVDNNGNTIGTATTSNTVTGGSVHVAYTLPAGLAAGTYTIKAVYRDSTNNGGAGNFADSSDATHKLTLDPAFTTTTATSTTATFSTDAQNVMLTATVTSTSGTVNEGTVTFTLFDSHGNMIGQATSGVVINGSTSVNYILPGGTPVGSYTIGANYSDSAGNFDASADNSQTLTVNTANATSVSLTSFSITPDLTGGMAQVTLTAQVSNPDGTVNEGTVSFTVAGVSGQSNVTDGTATVQLTVPLANVLYGLSVAVSYSDNATTANFADNSTSLSVSTSAWNALLPANLTFDSGKGEQMQFSLGSLPLFSALYSASTGLLSQVNLGSLTVPVTYTNLGNLTVATVGGVAWGLIFYDSNGSFQGIADVETASDGSLQWVIYDASHHPLGSAPYEL